MALLSLADGTQKQKNSFNEKADSLTKKVYQEDLIVLLSSAKNVGDIASDFALQNTLGEKK